MKSKDVRARVFLHPARQTDCVVEVKIVECSYDVESTVPGAVICCKVEFIPEVIKALRADKARPDALATELLSLHQLEISKARGYSGMRTTNRTKPR